MADTNLPLHCQVGDCGNRAAVTVTITLPIDWSESRTYNAVTLQVAACEDCAQRLEGHASTLIAARVQYGRLREKTEEGTRARTQLVALVEAIGAPYEPVQGTTFDRWLAALDRGSAQAAWRLLADVKRRRVGGALTATSLPSDCVHSEPPGPPLRIDGARLRHRVLAPAPPRPAGPPTNPTPRGGDDAA